VRTIIFIFLLSACQLLAADPNPAVLVTREYRVSPRFIAWLEQSTNPTAKQNEPKEWLMQSGVTFGPTTSALYIAESRKLIVRHTKSYHDALKQLLANWSKQGRNGPPDPKILQKLRELDAAYKQ